MIPDQTREAVLLNERQAITERLEEIKDKRDDKGINGWRNSLCRRLGEINEELHEISERINGVPDYVRRAR